MANVFDVAKYILQQKGKMSTWKLQKLCYYSQAWHMAWTKHPMVGEKFEAWANGPVCLVLYQTHKGKFLLTEEDLLLGDGDNLTDDEKESIEVILNGYGDKAPYELREMTHAESPWRNARDRFSEGVSCEPEIPVESMVVYYGGL